ncbi:hypothetical protein DFH29DRAFT_616458 [Suillus ampliporus]|nr:hypothetical protein DFH29DRAFT_616458 [Suillus ampliporus]
MCFSFVSREIGEFVINATGGAESGPSKRKHGRDGRLGHEGKREMEERGRQRRGYDGGMIEQWREVSSSVDGGGKKRIEKTKDSRKSSIDGRGRSRRERERRASSGSPLRSQSAERPYSHTHSQSQSREPSRSRTKKTKARTSSDVKQAKSRAKSTDGYGRKKYQDRPEDADGELTPSVTSRSPSPRRNNHSRGGKVRPRPQQETTSSHHPPQATSSQPNPPSPSNPCTTSPPLPSSHSILTEVTYPTLRKKPSITMPGSLFPRSDSLEPEPDEGVETRKVRFLSASENTHAHERNPNSIPRTPSGLNAQESEPSPSNSQNANPADETGPSPWRTRPIASVHDAVERFTASGGEEREFSLLVAVSPAGPVSPESPGTIHEKPHSPLSSVSRKGKERAVDDGDEDLAFILDHHRVQDKEKQLDAARRETGAKGKTKDVGGRERDKERIRMLEEEVRMLKEELSRGRRSPPPSQPQTQVPIPPPPPPLPPPPGVRIPLLPHLGETGALFASARAALRSTEVSTTSSANEVRKGGKAVK